ncbi:MAG: DNA cytosine methyltransferase [Paracoccaceae bacterium]
MDAATKTDNPNSMNGSGDTGRDEQQTGKGIVAVDLFCGVGGLTHGLSSSGVDVRLGVDLDPGCRYPYEQNNDAAFMEADVSSLDAELIRDQFDPSRPSLLAGCAPCQPFSTYSRRKDKTHPSEDWKLVHRFGELVRQTQPDLVTMENVPPLAQQGVFQELLDELEGYSVDWRVLNCDELGTPQTRSRLVLVASRLGPISIPEFDLPVVTVRDTIGGLPSVAAGEKNDDDPLHCASGLSETNLRRIRASRPGGTWRDWPEDLRAACHRRDTGTSYPSVYGRMDWDAPAPTMTTQCFGYGNGRFGHPEQDRAITLREAAMLQGFPRDYAFLQEGEKVNFSQLGRLIGNAVPVSLGRAIGSILVDHVAKCTTQM